jgi:circadian clock protein KaiC
MIIGQKGIDILAFTREESPGMISTERVSTGFERFDTMLSGGYLRGTTMLITGAPGTSKSTLSAAFADAACRRGEKTLYATFDTRAEVMVRDMSSVNIHLGPHIESGMLKVYSKQSQYMSPEKHLSALKEQIREHRPDCMVIDPISAMIKAGGRTTAENISLQLILLTQSKGITLVCTSLMEGGDPLMEKSAVRISTIADTWIHVSFFPLAGERNRALTIIKSRGTGHSNQVRELILSSSGLTIADVYTEEGEVLMGTLRRQKEQKGEKNRELLEAELETKKRQLEQAEQQTLAQIEALKMELESQRSALKVLKVTEKEQKEQWIKAPELMGRLRGADKVT